MPKPKIFVSSTYLDLQEIRDDVHNWINNEMGYDAVSFEKGGIFFDPQKKIDDSCYNEVRNCHFLISIIGKRHGSKASRGITKKKHGIDYYNSVTKKEFLTARENNLDTFIFVHYDILQEHKTYEANNKNLQLNYQSVDDPKIFLLIDDLYNLKYGNFIKDYKFSKDIISHLRMQWALLFKNALLHKRNTEFFSSQSKLNAYKMFFYRHQKKIDFSVLSNKTKINQQRLERLERIKGNKEWSSQEAFHNCPIDDISKIEKALECPRELKSGKDNDFSTEFMLYYREYKLLKANTPNTIQNSENLFKHKVVVFDFDGTMTIKNSEQIGKTTWESLWVELGYDVKLCSKYFNDFMDKKISHQEWCDITANYFIERQLSTEHINRIVRKTILVPNLRETLEHLKKHNIKMYITSGSILYVISHVLGDLKDFFDEISANDMIFDEKGYLTKILSTEYDFTGKADYVKKIAKQNLISTPEVIYIGNSINDNSVYKSGCDTLCVNPHFTDPTNKTQWKDYIPNMTKFSDIIDYINLPNNTII